MPTDDAETFETWRDRLTAFVDDVVVPAEARMREPAAEPFGRPPLLDELRSLADAERLGHLFSRVRRAELGFSVVELAQLAEICGRSPLLAQDAVRSLNPDAEVVNLLAQFGTDEQRARWLPDLLDGRIGSALCVTEPDVASSDPSGLRTHWTRGVERCTVSGRKSWALGALSPRCSLLVVLVRTDPDAPRRQGFSLLLVPVGSPGVTVGASATVYGADYAARGGLPTVDFDEVAVAEADVLGGLGDGLAVLQAALGPARLYHCMRLVGAAERALELTCRRLVGRELRQAPLADNALWQDRVARARIAIDQARAFTLAVAADVDANGIAGAQTRISSAKAAVPEAMAAVIDMAVQAHGAAGMSDDLPLAALWTHARSQRFSDGPDEVHRSVVGRAELARYRVS